MLSARGGATSASWSLDALFDQLVRGADVGAKFVGECHGAGRTSGAGELMPREVPAKRLPIARHGSPNTSALHHPLDWLGFKYPIRATRYDMKLEYEELEDSYDDTTNIRTMTEQAIAGDKGVLLRTTIYSPHHLSVNVVFVPGVTPFTPVVD